MFQSVWDHDDRERVLTRLGVCISLPLCVESRDHDQGHSPLVSEQMVDSNCMRDE